MLGNELRAMTFFGVEMERRFASNLWRHTGGEILHWLRVRWKEGESFLCPFLNLVRQAEDASSLGPSTSSLCHEFQEFHSQDSSESILGYVMTDKLNCHGIPCFQFAMSLNSSDQGMRWPLILTTCLQACTSDGDQLAIAFPVNKTSFMVWISKTGKNIHIVSYSRNKCSSLPPISNVHLTQWTNCGDF